MTKPFIKISRAGYHFTERGIGIIEEKYNAKYMGFWTVPHKNGGWVEIPIDIFYVANPDTSKGHSHYFGMYVEGPEGDERVMITRGDGAFEKTMEGILTPSGEVLVSHYRHDYRTHGDMMVDGGRDYFRCSLGLSGKIVYINVKDGEFVISEEIQIDPADRDWEYSGEGVKVKKDTNESI